LINFDRIIDDTVEAIGLLERLHKLLAFRSIERLEIAPSRKVAMNILWWNSPEFIFAYTVATIGDFSGLPPDS
jgi:hypothetical protein